MFGPVFFDQESSQDNYTTEKYKIQKHEKNHHLPTPS